LGRGRRPSAYRGQDSGEDHEGHEPAEGGVQAGGERGREAGHGFMLATAAILRALPMVIPAMTGKPVPGWLRPR